MPRMLSKSHVIETSSEEASNFGSSEALAYIHTYIHTTYLHSYIRSSETPAHLTTYIPTYLHTYIHTYIHTYALHTYIRSSEAPKQDIVVGYIKHTMRTMRTIGRLASQRPLVIPRRQRSRHGIHYARLSSLRLSSLCVCRFRDDDPFVICMYIYIYIGTTTPS
jgi:hypothetical protein